MTVAATLTAHPLFPQLKQWLRFRPNRGAELSPKAPLSVQTAALGVRGQCAHCRLLTSYFRRRTDGTIYVALTCPNEVNPACSRSGRAADSAAALAAACKGQKHEEQATLL